jgi:inosine-uridine nucleoside N-ribohydrolase
MKVLIDTDPGIDDALALLLALRSPELDILGITTVHGNIEVDKGTHNAAKVLALVGRDVTIARGADRPLLRPLRTAPFIHGSDGLGDLLPTPETVPLSEAPAVEFMLGVLRRSRDPVTLLALGPLTNIALLLRAHPDARAHIDRIVLMGGAVASEGNTVPGAEFNMHCDPEAAAIVFEAGVSLTMVGLNVTMKAVLPGKKSQALLGDSDPVRGFVGEVTSFYRRYYKRYYGIDGCCLHDPLTAAVLIEPEVIQTKHLHVDVETRGDHTAGATVADLWGIPEPAGRPNADVATELDVQLLLKLFSERVLEVGK